MIIKLHPWKEIKRILKPLLNAIYDFQQRKLILCLLGPPIGLREDVIGPFFVRENENRRFV